jgi:hypothetical protein
MTETRLTFPIPADAAAFDPTVIRILSDALDAAWRSVQSDPGTMPTSGGNIPEAREILARCIIELAKHGERNRGRLRDAALAHLAEANVRKARP